MRFIKKVLIVILLLILINIPLNAKANTEYKEKLIELRGVWVATVSNIDIDTQYSIESFQSQYKSILNTLEKFNMNAVFFQIRPTNDAFYESEINPWSEFLTGFQGKDPGWDPLPWLIEETHKRGMEFHAWLNPYRASLDVFSSTNLSESQYQAELNAALKAMDAKNFAKKNPDLLIQGDKRILLNPGEPKVRQHIFSTISEIIAKYDVDSIHFDDYFYNGVTLNRDKNLYLKSTNQTTYDETKHRDWRREQVDILIKGIHDLIDVYNVTNNKNIQFGISPAGGWAPSSKVCTPYPVGYGMPDGMEGYPCFGYSSYNDLFADTRKWVKEEWIDYILPQNYFDIDRYHDAISKWWNEQVKGTDVKLYMGLPMHEVASNKYSEYEISNQLVINQKYENVKGFVLFSYKNLVNLNSSLETATFELQNKYWTKKTLLPIRYRDEVVSDVKASNLESRRQNKLIKLMFNANEEAIGYLLYRFNLNETPVFNDDNYYDVINNIGVKLEYYDTVNNDDTFKYYLKAVLVNGNISNQVESIAVSNSFINTAPTIKSIKLNNIIFNMNEVARITGNVEDPDFDTLEVSVEFAGNGTRYTIKKVYTLKSNNLNIGFDIPRQASENAKLRITVTDGTESDVYVIEDLIIVEGMDSFQKYMHSTLVKFNNRIKQIWG